MQAQRDILQRHALAAAGRGRKPRHRQHHGAGVATRAVDDAHFGADHHRGQLRRAMGAGIDGADDLAMALRAGARGYLLKNIDAAFLVTAIQRAAAGESVMREAMTTKLMQQFRAGAATPLPSDEARLTPREREILACLARGESNKEIARRLDLAESTVKIHVQNILKKLGLSSRVQAAVYAVEHGLTQSLG